MSRKKFVIYSTAVTLFTFQGNIYSIIKWEESRIKSIIWRNLLREKHLLDIYRKLIYKGKGENTIPEAGGIPYSNAVKKSSSIVTSYRSSSLCFSSSAVSACGVDALFSLCCLTCSSKRRFCNYCFIKMISASPVSWSKWRKAQSC